MVPWAPKASASLKVWRPLRRVYAVDWSVGVIMRIVSRSKGGKGDAIKDPETLRLKIKTHRRRKQRKEKWQSSGDVDVEKSLKHGA